MNNSVARIIDVNLNRAGEALRTLEEYARLIMDSPGLTERAKMIRHAIGSISRRWTERSSMTGIPLFNRDISGDVGAGIKAAEEARRPDAMAVAAAAFRRAAEALRVLSEYGKIDHPDLATEFEKIRYDLYALEPLMLADASLKQRLRESSLYVLITGSLSSVPALTAAREAVAGGADIIQMREKEMEDMEFHRLAEQMVEVCREHNAIFLVNDRPHIASLVDASGIHGGQGDLPVHLARRVIGQHKIIGRSTSEPALAEKALADGADYIGVGPVYETDTKRHRRPVGLEYVSWARNWDKLPFFAIGSVNRDTIGGVLDAGARAVAICTAITKAPDIAAETAFYKGLLVERRRADG